VEIQATINNDLWIFGACYSLASQEERDAISLRLKSNTSVAVDFSHHGRKQFQAIFDFERDCLHVRIVAGKFLKHYKLLNDFALALARLIGAHYVSFNTEKEAVARIAEKAGYFKSDSPLEYVRAV
jgi:hypothetical protein